MEEKEEKREKKRERERERCVYDALYFIISDGKYFYKGI